MQAVKLPSNRIWHGLPIAHVYGVNDGKNTIEAAGVAWNQSLRRARVDEEGDFQLFSKWSWAARVKRSRRPKKGGGAHRNLG